MEKIRQIKSLIMFFSLLKKAFRFMLMVLLSFTLVLTWTAASQGQLPFSSPASDQGIPQLPRWDPNKARACGKFWCSEVHFYGNKQLSGELILAAFIRNPKNPELSSQETAYDLGQRAKSVQRIFEEIVRTIVRYRPGPQLSAQKNWQFWLLTTKKPLHPLTPNIEVGIQNQETVVYVPKQKDLGLLQQTVITVTVLDAKVNAKSIAELAQIWRQAMRQSISNVLWGNEFDLQYPAARTIIAGAIALMAAISIQIIRQLRRFLRQWNKSLKERLKNLNDSLRVNPEAVTTEDMSKSLWKNISSIKFWLLLLELDYLAAMLFLRNPERNDTPATLKSETPRGGVFSKLTSLFQFLRLIGKWEMPVQIFAKVSLQNQFLLKQERNLSELLLRISWLTIFSIILIALGLIVGLFRPSRFLIYLFLEQIYMLPLIWIGMLLADKLTDFFIDYALNRWLIERQESDPGSNRYTLRANTYSKAFTSATTFFFVIVGTLITVWLIGINTSVLASAGALAVVFAYLSRNLIEDMLNGILILATDRYAVGDVIDLGEGFSGFVEDMNLYGTTLRNLDGQVLVVPNGKISKVINMTKDWSRVNFTLKIAWNAKVRKAIAIMRQVAEQMQAEPQWQEMIVEPVDILGVDDLSHDGILIHLLIKTRPMQQWLVGREYRLRVKEALDEAGIHLGVPQREVAFIHSHVHFPKNNRSG